MASRTRLAVKTLAGPKRAAILPPLLLLLRDLQREREQDSPDQHPLERAGHRDQQRARELEQGRRCTRLGRQRACVDRKRWAEEQQPRLESRRRSSLTRGVRWSRFDWLACTMQSFSNDRVIYRCVTLILQYHFAVTPQTNTKRFRPSWKGSGTLLARQSSP
jgi:hypothetical protein